jgi:hypothetical protein
VSPATWTTHKRGQKVFSRMNSVSTVTYVDPLIRAQKSARSRVSVMIGMGVFYTLSQGLESV